VKEPNTPRQEGKTQNTGGNTLPATLDTYTARAAAIHLAQVIWRCERYGWPRLTAPINISNPRYNPNNKGSTGYATLLERSIKLSTTLTLKIKCSRTDYTTARDHLPENLKARMLEYIATDYPANGKRTIPTPAELEPWTLLLPALTTKEGTP
jgi:hypothetical protein